MSLTKNLGLVFKTVPKGLPLPGKDLTIEDRPIDFNGLPECGVVVRNVYQSLDPYMRLMMVGPETQHYRQPFTLNEPLRSLAIAEVIKSSHADLPTETLLRTSLPIQQFCILSPEDIKSRQNTGSSASLKVLPSQSTSGIHPACWLGPLGMPGLTAYSSIFEIGKPQPGETIFVSSAAGAVGQIVGQICKIRGLKVIGSAGSTEKCNLLTNELHFDAAFNYKEESTLPALRRLSPDGIDIYYDNVGGQTLEDALAHMRDDGRIVICGMVSQYNSTSSQDTSQGEYGVKNLFQFVSRGLTMRGFRVSMKEFGPKYQTHFEDDMQRWIRNGQIKPVISEANGIQVGDKAFSAMLEGKNIGKAVLRMDALEATPLLNENSESILHRIDV